MTDTVGGAGNLSVITVSSNNYDVADQLGLAKSVSSNTLSGDDINPAMPNGLFSHLMALRDAMLVNDDHANAYLATLPQQEIHQRFLGSVLLPVQNMVCFFDEEHESKPFPYW